MGRVPGSGPSLVPRARAEGAGAAPSLGLAVAVSPQRLGAGVPVPFPRGPVKGGTEARKEVGTGGTGPVLKEVE